MTALKPLKSTTALARILVLPLMVGTLASCGYASRLPDAPSSLGYELADKPPSVTGNGEVKRLPPPPISRGDAFAKLNSPVEYRAAADVAVDKPALSQEDFKAPVDMAAVSKKPTVESVEEVAFKPLEFEAVENRTAEVDIKEFEAPPMETVALSAPDHVYSVPSAPMTSYGSVEMPAPTLTQNIAYDPAPVSYETTEAAPTSMQPVYFGSEVPSQTGLETISADSYAVAAAPTMMAEPVSAPLTRSPISILRARMANGAVVNVHPIIGTPGAASSTLARTVLMELGAPINETIAKNAQVVFDLRGRADRNTEGYVSVEWTLHDSNGNTVGSFRERHEGDGWKQMSDDVIVAMGRRVADRINRNGQLRQATLYAANNAPSTNYIVAAPEPNRTFVLKKGARLASAPMPMPSPRRGLGIRSVAGNPAIGPIVTQHPQAMPISGVVAQVPTPTRAVQPPPPQIRTVAPRSLIAAPAPSFDTLRAPGSTVAQAAPVVNSGPRPLVFQGVNGAPGDGDQSLSREVAKLLRDSGANVSSNGGPSALFLTAQVSKTPTANADRIEIVWRVSDASGNSIGQVTQANDVPRGMLDRSWGEDAFYAAQGARDGIMQLLQSSGALDS